MTNLYLANGDELSEGSSIFLSKGNVNKRDAVLTIGVPALLFFESLRCHIEKDYDEYSVILRLNCEGVEDDVIYSAHQVFSRRLALTMGSLKDVKECKGNAAYEALEDYLSLNEIPFVSFSSSPLSWGNAHKSIREVVGKESSN